MPWPTSLKLDRWTVPPEATGASRMRRRGGRPGVPRNRRCATSQHAADLTRPFLVLGSYRQPNPKFKDFGDQYA